MKIKINLPKAVNNIFIVIIYVKKDKKYKIKTKPKNRKKITNTKIKKIENKLN